MEQQLQNSEGKLVSTEILLPEKVSMKHEYRIKTYSGRQELQKYNPSCQEATRV